ncbi:hypothetical protein O9X98_15730 [Agrobacterium salinitolerans]|nr:hypothetical protein [Agrobacterium salinitolerans]
MRLDIKFPIMARAVPKGSRHECRMLVSHNHAADVREVSSRETEVPVRTVVQDNARGIPYAMRELRLHEGRLYRHFGLDTILGNIVRGGELIAEAFGDFGVRTNDHIASTEGKFDGKSDVSPLSKPIKIILEDRLEALSMDGADARNRTWPRLYGAGVAQNERLTLDEALEQVHSVNGDDLEEAFSMHRTQADKLLLIDNELWYETGPPCYAVETQWKEKASQSSVVIRYRLMPDAMDHAISTIYYPVSALDQARAAAETMRRRLRMAGVSPWLGDFAKHHGKFAYGDHPAFSFDPSEDFVNRTGHALAMNILKAATQRPDKFGSVDADWLGELASAFATFNPLLGRDIDYAERLPALAETYLEVSPYKSTGLAALSYKQVRKSIEMAVDHLDNMPISVHGLAAGPARLSS